MLHYVGILEYTEPQKVKQLATFTFKHEGDKLVFLCLDCGACELKNALRKTNAPESVNILTSEKKIVYPSSLKNVKSQNFTEISETTAIMNLKFDDFNFLMEFTPGFLKGNFSSPNSKIKGKIKMLMYLQESDLLDTISYITFLESNFNQKEFLEKIIHSEIIFNNDIAQNDFNFSYAKVYFEKGRNGESDFIILAVVGECKSVPVIFWMSTTPDKFFTLNRVLFPQNIDALYSDSDSYIEQIENAFIQSEKIVKNKSPIEKIE